MRDQRRGPQLRVPLVAQTAIDPTTIDQAYAQSLVGPSATLRVVTTTIQAAVSAAAPGDVIFVPAGTYTENVQVRTPGLTIVGPRNAVLDGTGLSGVTGIDVRPATGVTSFDGFNLVGLSIRDYRRNGVFLRGVSNYKLLSGQYIDNAEFGLFPVRSTTGLIERNEVSGSNDTGIYVGQSRGAVIRNNLAFDNTIGIEIENSTNMEIRNNITRDNSVGLFGVVLPLRSIAKTEYLTIIGNQSLNNNRANPVTDPTDVLSRLPFGVGMLFLATDLVGASENQITGNGSVGLGLFSLPADLSALDPRIDPEPDFNVFFDNIITGNGGAPDPKLAALGFAPFDILWDGTGRGNGWRDNVFGTSFPLNLPAPIPEPASWVMMIAGFALAGRALSRRDRSGARGHPIRASFA